MVVALALLATPPRAAASAWPAWLSASSQTQATGLASATAALRALPVGPTPVIAAHATPEGHWQFSNRAGETFTAGTPAELKRASSVLLPDAIDGFASATLILSQDTLFTGAAVLKDLPAARSLATVIAGDVLAVQRSARNTLSVALRPSVTVAADDKDAFAEALAQLHRPLDAAHLRILSAVPGGPASLPAIPKFDAAQGGAAIDTIDPDHIASALASIPRQTAILTARLDGANLSVQPPSGPQRTLSYASLTAAAASADVDLLVLHADPPRQPGGRNWLWQRIQVSGLEHAAKRGTLADFLDQLATGHDPFAVSIAADGDKRVRLTAQPIPVSIATTQGVTDWIKQAAGSVAGQVTGAVEPAAIHASLVSTARRTELSRRLIPGLPSSATAIYLAALMLGLFGLPVALRWWRRLWPSEARADYASTRGYILARLIRALTFVALFLPLAAIPALLTRIAGSLNQRTAHPIPNKSSTP